MTWRLRIDRCPTHLEGPAYKSVKQRTFESREAAIKWFGEWWLEQTDERLDDLSVSVWETA